MRQRKTGIKSIIWGRVERMLKAILFDLDDTLLGNKTDTFLQTYFGVLGGYMKDKYDMGVLMPALLQSIQYVVKKPDFTQTNADQFWAYFAPQLNTTRAEIEPHFRAFYQERFSDVRPATQQRPVARELVHWCFEQGLHAVVATNPLFPAVAIEERLRWAGLPVAETPFALVTTMENMFAAKPHAAYYEYILEKVACEPHEVLMVGDDMANDIMPAFSLGCHTFWLDHEQEPDDQVPTETGTLAELFAKLQAGWLQ